MSGVLGIHHVSAISTDPQRTVNFYTGVLGMRLVKQTVNFDAPRVYHLYFGDESGSPGSLLTFFPWPRGRRGRQGVGQVATVSLSVSSPSLGFWLERLVKHGVAHEGPKRRVAGNSAERLISFTDPDGLLLEIVAHESVPAEGTNEGAAGVPPEHAIRSIHSVTLWEERGEDTARVLVDLLGFVQLHEDATIRRFGIGDGPPGTLVEVRSVGGFLQSVEGTGTVHHVAWRVPDDSAQLALRERVVEDGLDPTAVIDRFYFRSVYFREPGGVLFELATDPPGFTIDETPELLGQRLMLPPRLELERSSIEAALPPLHHLDEREHRRSDVWTQ